MKNTIIILVITLLSSGCDISETDVDSKKIEQTEEVVTLKNDRNTELFKSAITIIKNDTIEVRTADFHDFESNEFVARLYLMSNGDIIDQIDRVNFKYHPGEFIKSEKFNHLGDVILFQNVLPTSSVPHVVLEKEYIQIIDDKFYCFLDFTAIEKDCGRGVSQGKLITRTVEFTNNVYTLIEEEYKFDCKDFDFDAPIKNTTLVNVNKKEINITAPVLHR